MSGEKSRKIEVIAVVSIILFLGGYMMSRDGQPVIEPDKYPFKEFISGANVYSTIEPREIASWQNIALYESDLPGALACNLQFSTLKARPEAQVHTIGYESGEQAVIITERDITIRGEDRTQIQYNCNVVACLLSNLTCPTDLDDIKRIMWYTNELNVIFDSTLSSSSMGAYAELMGPLGFYQIMKADVNKDGTLDEREEAANKIFIKPFMKENDSCIPQPLKNFVQNPNQTDNRTRDCDISPGLYLAEGPLKKVSVEGRKIMLQGDSNALRASAIIVGNIIAPDFMEFYRRAG